MLSEQQLDIERPFDQLFVFEALAAAADDEEGNIRDRIRLFLAHGHSFKLFVENSKVLSQTLAGESYADFVARLKVDNDWNPKITCQAFASKNKQTFIAVSLF